MAGGPQTPDLAALTAPRANRRAALVITLAGIAAVIGTSVSQRTREFGLRMALGATRASLLGMVLGQGWLFEQMWIPPPVRGSEPIRDTSP